jgi:threonine dehydratase
VPQFSLDELEEAARLVQRHMRPTPEYVWPLLNEATFAEVWVKHENHSPTGAFKVRGGVTYIDWLKRTQPEARGICTATRGNHGQSQARAATAAGLTAKVYVPVGNSPEKNAAMRAFGAELVEFGDDFDTAREESVRVASAEGLVVVPPFHHEIVRGVSTYAYELFSAAPNLHSVYVPIGCGSGICGTIAARDALGLKTRVVGVVSDRAQTAKLSVEAGRAVETATADTFADGVAVRVPVSDALAIYSKGAERIVTVSDEAVADAIRLYFRTTHNLAEGAGAAPLAALISEREKMRGKKVGLILSGGNIDSDKFAVVMNGNTPRAS